MTQDDAEELDDLAFLEACNENNSPPVVSNANNNKAKMSKDKNDISYLNRVDLDQTSREIIKEAHKMLPPPAPRNQKNVTNPPINPVVIKNGSP